MKEQGSDPGQGTRVAIGAVLFLGALVFYYFAVLDVDFRKTALLDFNPHPDADEYFGQARSLADTGIACIQIGHEQLPSRFPPGYPLLVAAWLKLLPAQDAVLAPFRTNQSIGLISLVALFAIYCWRHRPFEGGVASLLLATLPGFVSYSRSSISDLSAGTFSLACFVLVALGFLERKRWLIYAGVLLLGLAVNIRMQLVFFGPLLLAMALFPVSTSRGRWLFHGVAAVAIFVLAASPLLILNTIEFGGPFKTGYEFWVPTLTDKHWVFSLQNVPQQTAMLRSELTATWTGFRVANIFGTGTYIVPAFALLTLTGSFLGRMGRFEFCALLAVLTFFVATVTYRFVEGRFYLPLMFLLVPVATRGVSWAASQVRARRHLVSAGLILILFILAVVGYPSRSGYKPQGNRVQLWDAVQFARVPRSSTAFEAEQALISAFSDKPGLLLSSLDPVSLNAMLPRPFVAAPMDDKHHYRHSFKFRYGLVQATALIQQTLAAGQPIYALFVSEKDFASNASRLPRIEGYHWVTAANTQGTAVIMRLVPSLSGEHRIGERRDEAFNCYSVLYDRCHCREDCQAKRQLEVVAQAA